MRVEFDETPDIDSEAFSEAYIDWQDRYIHLVFKGSGTSVSRLIPEHVTPDTFKNIESWGKFWWDEMKFWPAGRFLDNSNEFVQRKQEPVSVATSGPYSVTISTDETTFNVPSGYVHVVPGDGVSVGPANLADLEDDTSGWDEPIGEETVSLPPTISLTIEVDNFDDLGVVASILMDTAEFLREHTSVRRASLMAYKDFDGNDG